MNYSGILIMAKPQFLPDITEALMNIDGVEVFQQEHATGKIVAVLEAENIKAETDMLRTIKQVPGVAAAEMVYHYFEDDQEVITHIPTELDLLQGLGAVPEALQGN